MRVAASLSAGLFSEKVSFLRQQNSMLSKTPQASEKVAQAVDISSGVKDKKAVPVLGKMYSIKHGTHFDTNALLLHLPDSFP